VRDADAGGAVHARVRCCVGVDSNLDPPSLIEHRMEQGVFNKGYDAFTLNTLA
jgi:hypothetical protein